ncbi:apolipoprotein N-acyltransferase [uncultured Sphingomonas sp.]|uniref:apolipoprotein N-acyltransferase n=1 Tax=uncultured Sphingomonas sp. TaxID=158754 RepID=UPI0035C98787
MNRRPALACVLLGAAAACGFAPLDLWPLTLACFAAWLWLVHDAPTVRSALWRGWLFGLGHFTINDNWFQHAFDFQDAMPPVLGYAAPVVLALYLAVYPMLAAGVAWRLASARAAGDRTTPPGWPFVLVFGAAWIATEWLRATMFTGYAWDPLGVVWVPVQPVASIAAWVGTYALSGLTIILAGAAIAIRRWRWRWPIVIGVIAILLTGQAFSYQEWATPWAPPLDYPRIRVVQPNIGQDQRGETDGAMMLRTLGGLSGRSDATPRLLLWPEGVVRDYLEGGYPNYIYDVDPAAARARLARLLGPRDILLAGGTALQFGRGVVTSASNSIYALDARGRILARYDKAHLVPYGEYLPMRPVLSAIGLSRLVPGDVDFKEGPGPRTFALPGFGMIGMQLCYEIVFSGQIVDEAHRPRLLFNPSNDAWFGRWGPPQHLAQARMRAVEEGLPVIRSTPTGISAIIAADGRLITGIPAGRAGAVEEPVPDALPPTPFSRIGNAAAAIVAAAMLLLGVAIRRRAR